MVMPCGSTKDPGNQDKSAPNGHCAFEDLDHSVLQQPLNLGVSNIKQILKCVQSGSREVKDIILNECNIIYECKECFSLFRSLANFMYHKRCYCKKHLCEDMLLFEHFEEPETVVVQPEPPSAETEQAADDSYIIPKLPQCTVSLIKADIQGLIPVATQVENPKQKKEETISSEAKDIPLSDEAIHADKNIEELNLDLLDIVPCKEPAATKTCNNSDTTSEGDAIMQTEERERKDEVSSDGSKDEVHYNEDNVTVLGKSSDLQESMINENDENQEMLAESFEEKEFSNRKVHVNVDTDNMKMHIKLAPPNAQVSNKMEVDNTASEETMDMGYVEPEENSKSKNQAMPDNVDIAHVDKGVTNTLKEQGKLALKVSELKENVNRKGTVRGKLITVVRKDIKDNNVMISRRTRDKNAREPLSAVITKDSLERSLISKEPVVLKLIPKESSKLPKNLSQKFPSIISKKDSKPDKTLLAKFKSNRMKSIQNFPMITLKNIENNSNAVYQSPPKKDGNQDYKTKTESHVLQTKTDKDKIIIVVAKKDIASGSIEGSSKAETSENSTQAVGKCNKFRMTRRKKLLNRSDCDVNNLKCLTCNTQFTTLKTLYSHMLSLHSKKRLYYPCPFCNELFLQIYGVNRHLMVTHNKTKDQINKLKDMIKRKSIWKRVEEVCDTAEDIKYSKPETVSRKVYALKEEKKVEAASSKQEPFLDTVNGVAERRENSPIKTLIKLDKNFTLHNCSKCNRVFGRKSSQVSHEKFCIMNAIKVDASDQANSPTKSSSVVSLIPISPVKQADSSMRLNRPKRGAEKQMHKDFVNSQTLKWRSANKIDTNDVTPTLKRSYSKNVEKKIMNIIDMDNLLCLKCNRRFSSFSNLRRHAAIHIGWTRFKCKNCDYQAYNKSQCWAHIQKAHNINNDLEKYVVHLIGGNVTRKRALMKHSTQMMKQNAGANNRTSPTKQKIVYSKTKISKQKPAAVSTKALAAKKHSQKKEKGLRNVQLHKFPALDYRKEITNYKSVTTSNPTTIILSKKFPSLTVQPNKDYPASLSSTSSNKVLTSSPAKKTFKEVRSLTSLVTRSTAYPKSSAIHMKFPMQENGKQDSNKDAMSADKGYVKKDKLISEWFPKKGFAGSSITRRDSAPLIIGLVPASNTGVNARTKSSGIPFEKSNT